MATTIKYPKSLGLYPGRFAATMLLGLTFCGLLACATAPVAEKCALSPNPNAWGPVGQSGWARQWLLGQCDLANANVITYVNLPADCKQRNTQATCVGSDLLGACGPAQVTLRPEDCRNCQPACVIAGPTCKLGRCSNNGQPCANEQNCTFSKPVNGACAQGTLVNNWTEYYIWSATQAGLPPPGSAPLTYCAWR